MHVSHYRECCYNYVTSYIAHPICAQHVDVGNERSNMCFCVVKVVLIVC